jgi:hypothetical protein
MEGRSRESVARSRGNRVGASPLVPAFLLGNDGSDVLKGQADDDNVFGRDQNDSVYGGQGADATEGNFGNDFVKTRDRVSGNDIADGGENTDRCVIDAGDAFTGCEL